MADEIEIDQKLRKVFSFVEAQTKVLMDRYEIEGESEAGMEKLVQEHLEQWYSFTEEGHLKGANIPINFQFDELFEWVNTESPRGDLNELASSNLIIFDFFTHCCIDCIHSIEDLRQVHRYVKSIRSQNGSLPNPDSFECGFKIISIHSPKFTTEKKSDSIQSSVQRMKMEHTEVLNDPHRILWRQFGLHCWPTIMIFGPNVNAEQPGPNLLFAFTLDNHRDFLKLVSRVALAFFDKRISTEQVEKFKEGLAREEVRVKVAPSGLKEALGSKSLLNFPGKVTVYENLVCISDTGNNRIVLANLNGDLLHIIGGLEDGFQDGGFESARFYGPQGVAFENPRVFYVSDTGNHSIRKVDLDSMSVSTLVPPEHPILSLKSPWDLTFFTPEVLLIAGARTHQIFAYFFAGTELFGRTQSKDEVALVAGTGFEENRNHEDPLESSFSQPSGLVCTGSGDQRTVYIADSESSSIRCISWGGNVYPVVGASTDLYNLFAFGDQDGIGFDTKLQHPMAVTAVGGATLYITDTYNHKIKMIDVGSKACTTLIGNGQPGNGLGRFNVKSTETSKDSTSFNEPAGICVDASQKFLFIADTNNHSIKVAHLEDQIVSEFLPQPLGSSSVPKGGIDQIFDIFIPEEGRRIQLTINVKNVPGSFEGGNWKLHVPIFGSKAQASGSLIKAGEDEDVIIATPALATVPWLREAYVTVTIAHCKGSGCHLREFKLLLNFKQRENSNDHGDANPVIDFPLEKGAFE